MGGAEECRWRDGPGGEEGVDAQIRKAAAQDDGNPAFHFVPGSCAETAAARQRANNRVRSLSWTI